MDELIEVFGALREHTTRHASGRRAAKDRMTIAFDAPDLVFVSSESRIAQLGAQAIQRQIQENLRKGLQPSGQPLPAAAPATLERRRYRAQQAARGGALSPHTTDPQVRGRGLRNWRRRFVAPRLGAFTPKPSAMFGTESGMLAESVKALPEPPSGFKVFFAGPRGNLDRSGLSAVGRVFRRIAPWTRAAMRQGHVQEAMRRMLTNIFVGRARRMMETLAEFGRNVATLVSQDEDTRQGDALARELRGR